jgi:hypothetical protein
MKTDPDINEAIRELVEWMDGWELEAEYDDYTAIRDIEGGYWFPLNDIKQSLDLIREIEEAVEDMDLATQYVANLSSLCGSAWSGGEYVVETDEQAVLSDPEPRIRALRRTLREEGEIE